MNNKVRRAILGGFFGFLAVFFLFQLSVLAETGEASADRFDTNLAVAEFSLSPVGTLAPVAVESEAFAAPAAQFNPQFLPPSMVGGNGFGDTAFKSSLAVGFALNVADYFLTRQALKYQGAAEANPLMKGIVKNPYLFAAVKVGASAVSIFLLDKIYKKNKVLGWVLSAAVNSALSYVVLHNYGVLKQVKANASLQ